MAKIYRYIVDCADSHAEHGDVRGAEAIMYSAKNGKRNALRAYPDCKPEIDNAWAYARQEAA